MALGIDNHLGENARVEKIMVKVGEHVRIESEKVGQSVRSGIVMGVSGSLIRVRWENGTESSLIPKAGSLRVEEKSQPAKSRRKTR